MREMLVIVPTRSRPQNVAPLVEAWLDTDGFDAADLLFAIDADDPAYPEYHYQLDRAHELLRDEALGVRIDYHRFGSHLQLVPKLNATATIHAEPRRSRFALGFAGDDHRPRTPGWSQQQLAALRDLGTGIVYPDDGYQGARIPTSWAMTTDIIRALGAMVPAPVEHLFCDNAVRDLGEVAGCLRYLPDVLVEHLHPIAGKAEDDAQYQRVNSRSQWRSDKRAYREWCTRDLAGQADAIRAIRAGETAP